MGMSEPLSAEGQAVPEPALFEDLSSGYAVGGSRPLPPYDCPEYYMMFFKVLPCQKKYNHDWTCCPGAHPGERARRRCLLLYRYGAKVCPDMQMRGSCPRGEACYMTHGLFEFYANPGKYKTKMCKAGRSCKRHYCFFSHTPEEMREGCSIPDAWQLQMLPDGSFSSSSVATVLSCLPMDVRAAAQAAIAQLPQVLDMYDGDRSIQQQQQAPGMMLLQQQPGAGVQVGWGQAELAGSSRGPYQLVNDMALQGPPGMGQHAVLQQQPVLNGYITQQQHSQQQQELLQYGPACSLVSTGHQPQQQLGAVLRVPPHSTGGSGGPMGAGGAAGQHVLGGMVPMQAQQVGTQPGIVMSAQGVPAAGVGPTFLPGSTLQPALPVAGGSGSWAVAGQAGAPMGFTAVSGAAAAAALPAMLQANFLLPGQGMMLLPSGAQLPGIISQQPQQVYVPAAGALLQQNLEQQQQQMVSVPLSHAAVLGLQQQQQSPQRAQLQRAQVAHAAALPPGTGAIGGSPQQPVAVGDQLVQQLQALGLSGGSPQLQ